MRSTSSRAAAAGSPAELGPQVELLRKIGDTLGVLGLGELRDRVQGEIGRLEAIVAGKSTPLDDARWSRSPRP